MNRLASGLVSLEPVWFCFDVSRVSSVFGSNLLGPARLRFDVTQVNPARSVSRQLSVRYQTSSDIFCCGAMSKEPGLVSVQSHWSRFYS